MSGAILGLPKAGEPVELHPRPYSSEAALQLLLAEHLICADARGSEATQQRTAPPGSSYRPHSTT